MNLTFNEAAKGANKTIHLELMDTCPRCQGRGNEAGTKISQCGYCGGSGIVSVFYRIIYTYTKDIIVFWQLL